MNEPRRIRQFWMILVTLALMLGVGQAPMQTNVAVGQALPIAAASSTLLANGQFVNGPNVGVFDTTQYLQDLESPLIEYATPVDDQAGYYSINPRVLLTILELKSGVVTGKSSVPQNLLGYRDIEDVEAQLQQLGQELFTVFYQYLYAPAAAPELRVTFNNGESLVLEAQDNAATLALKAALAPLSSQSEWLILVSATEPGGFTQTYRRLFPESDPLDDSNVIIPTTAPPATLFKLPFSSGDTWAFTGGPHPNTGSSACGTAPWSAVDFAPTNTGACSNPVPTTRWITSPAAGTVPSTGVRCNGCLVEVRHTGGWGSYFYHVANPQVSNGQAVAQDQRIGNPSCRPTSHGACGSCGGSATGIHQHYSLTYNGAHVAIAGTAFEGWVVHATTCYNGYLEKNGQQIWRGGVVTSQMPDYTPPTVQITQHPPANQWYNTDQTIAWTISDVGSGVRGYKVAWNQNPPGGGEIGGASGSRNLSSAGQGQHTLYVQAWDNAGNASAVASVGWFGYDTVAPTYPTSVNPGCTAVSGVWQNTCNDPNFTWSGAHDATSGVAGYQVYWGADPNGVSEHWTSATSFDPGPVSDGSYYLRVRTRDHAGNWSSWATLFILRYDGAAPTNPNSVNPGCTASYGVWQNTCADANFTWSGAGDAASGVAGYEIYWGMDANGTGAYWSTAAAYNPAPVNSGAYYLRVRTKDNASNWSPWSTLFVLRYDGVAPTGSMTINHNATTTHATLVRLQSSATDAASGVCQMRFRDAGGAWTDWQNYRPATYWQLPGPTGRNFTVETQFKDCAGNTSAIYADAIALDIYPARPATSRYRIIKSTFGASGISSASNNYGLLATLGQPSMIGQMSSANYSVASGYWAMRYENFTVYLPLVLRQQ